MLTITADFNEIDNSARVRLDTRGALRDLETHADQICEGLRVLLDGDDILAEAILELHGGVWYGRIIEKTKRFR